MATKYGNNSANSITGTSSADLIYGRGGNDKLYGLGGNDKLYGEAGNDTLYGDAGSDTLYGGDNDDLFFGGYGNDLIYGGSGIDKLDYRGISSTGSVYYGVEAHLDLGYVATSVAGRDTVSGIENVDGSQVGDYLRGDGQANVLAGIGGSDYIDGDAGNDRLYGGDGDDRLSDGDGNDKLYGNAGDDTLENGAGNDLFWGGPNQDLFYFSDYKYQGYSENREGQDFIEDFVKGQDDIAVDYYSDNGSETKAIYSFYDLDTNYNGMLDNNDAMVSIKSVAHNGSTKVSTVIDVSSMFDQTHTITVFGVTGLMATDFTYMYYD